MRTTLAVSFAALLTACASTPPKPAPTVEVSTTGKPGEAAATKVFRYTATVKAVDLAARAITVEAEGNVQNFPVNDKVRLAEIAPGDKVEVEYKEGLLLEVQPADSAVVEPTMVAAGARSAATAAPGGQAIAAVQATVTIVAIDVEARTVTLKGPAGETGTVKLGLELDPSKLKVGDKVLATYAQSVAVEVKKE